jgi:hypothetical protein
MEIKYQLLYLEEAIKNAIEERLAINPLGFGMPLPPPDFLFLFYSIKASWLPKRPPIWAFQSSL